MKRTIAALLVVSPNAFVQGFQAASHPVHTTSPAPSIAKGPLLRIPSQARRSSSLTLDAALVGGRSEKDSRGRRRAFWSKLRPRRRTNKLQAVAVEEDLFLNAMEQAEADFLTMSQVTQGPLRDVVLPEITAQDVQASAEAYVDSEFFDVSIKAAPRSTQETVSTTKKNSISLNGAISMWSENVITSLVHRLAVEAPEEFSVQASPRSKFLPRFFLKGQYSTDATLDFGRLVFRNLRLSSGNLKVNKMTLNLFHGLSNAPRFPKQFDLHGHDICLSADDLDKSSCIRNGLRALLVRLLRDRGVDSSSIQVTKMDILPNGKLSCKGVAKPVFGPSIPFEVRTGIDSACRGHVLTFPGLEIAVGGKFFVPVVPEVDVDIGHNARLNKVHIDGARKQITFSASVTITPANTIRLGAYKQSSAAFAARFSTDVGLWLTNLGTWTK